MTFLMSFQLVVTIGPASDTLLEPLIEAGASALRLNTAHMSLEKVTVLAKKIRSLSSDLPIVFDLQGAKMRLGIFPPTPVKQGEEVVFARDPFGAASIPVEHSEFFEQVNPGEIVSVDDNRLRFEVLWKNAESALCGALADGVLKPRKGMNVTDHPVELKGLREFDREVCRLADQVGNMSCAISFMKDGSESTWVKELAPESSVIAKIERAEALSNLEDIVQRVDSVWICRGDLGAQIGLTRMAQWVSSLAPGRLPRPVWMAGQVLEHMTSCPEATRSEVCHLCDLIIRGYAGIVLSDETAIGENPVGTVKFAASLVRDFA
jgi:pyruvate kinase